MFDEITLKGGAVVFVDQPMRRGVCRKCRAAIVWSNTKETGKYMPIVRDGDGWKSHFADCPFAKEFRRKVKRDDDLYANVLRQQKRERW